MKIAYSYEFLMALVVVLKIMKYPKWDSADLNRGLSVPNAQGWTRLPYYPFGWLNNSVIR
jgi:hypothetical protein